MPDTTEIYQDQGGHWRWRLRAKNGQITATSGESFDNHSNAVRAASRFERNLLDPPDSDNVVRQRDSRDDG